MALLVVYFVGDLVLEGLGQCDNLLQATPVACIKTTLPLVGNTCFSVDPHRGSSSTKFLSNPTSKLFVLTRILFTKHLSI